MYNIDTLPDNILLNILVYLDKKSILYFALCNKTYHEKIFRLIESRLFKDMYLGQGYAESYYDSPLKYLLEFKKHFRIQPKENQYCYPEGSYLASNVYPSITPTIEYRSNGYVDCSWVREYHSDRLVNVKVISRPNVYVRKACFIQSLEIFGFSEIVLLEINPEDIWTMNLQSEYIPEIITRYGYFDNMKSLTLSRIDNKWKKIPKCIFYMKNLELLSLTVGLEYISEDISQLTKLIYLILDNNKLCKNPNSLQYIANMNISQLHLACNGLLWLPSEISKMPNLNILWLAGNMVRDFPFDELKKKSVKIYF